MSGSFTALAVAYSIAWIGVIAYLAYMHIRQRGIERDIRALKEEVQKNGE